MFMMNNIVGQSIAEQVPSFGYSTRACLTTILVIVFSLCAFVAGSGKRVAWNGPFPWPLIGSMFYLGRCHIPFAGFTYLRSFYGDIFDIRLGSMYCVVLNSASLSREALVEKGECFDKRPDFQRIRLLFGGDKQNALAFSDYDELQELRRCLLRTRLAPRSGSDTWFKLNDVCAFELHHMIAFIQTKIAQSNSSSVSIDMKPIILQASANIFQMYICSANRKEYSDDKFKQYIRAFDEIFWEVNTSRLCDLIPCLTWPTAWYPIRTTLRNAKIVRDYIIRHMVDQKGENDRRLIERNVSMPVDLVDSLISFIDGQDSRMTRDQALYTIEDVIGGHCAVGSIAIRAIWDILLNDEDQGLMSKIRTEAFTKDKRLVFDQLRSTKDHTILPLTIDPRIQSTLLISRAALSETLRLTCSPVVPHMASVDTEICGKKVFKDTVIFVNNHHINMDTAIWGENVAAYRPIERFLIAELDKSNDPCQDAQTHVCKQIRPDLLESMSHDVISASLPEPEDDRVNHESWTSHQCYRYSKPKEFLPFSSGRRGCVGYRMAEIITETIINVLVVNFDMSIDMTLADHKKASNMTPGGQLGLAPDQIFPVTFSISSVI